MDVGAQGHGPAGVGKKRLKVEVVLAAAALPLPPPTAAPLPSPSTSARSVVLPGPTSCALERSRPTSCALLLPDLTDRDLLAPHEAWLAALLALLPRADVYLQDEVQITLHPTLTRTWCQAGRRGQRRVAAPGANKKKWGFGLVDWRDGWFDWEIADGRWATPLCDQLRRAVEHSHARGRVAVVVLDNLGIHTPRGSKKLRALLEEFTDRLHLVYTPAYDPDSNRIEWLWAIFRDAVTHNHRRTTFDALLADANQWAADLTPAHALQHIGSPFAALPQLPEQLADVA
jgi:hypothetical protein